MEEEKHFFFRVGVALGRVACEMVGWAEDGDGAALAGARGCAVAHFLVWVLIVGKWGWGPLEGGCNEYFIGWRCCEREIRYGWVV